MKHSELLDGIAEILKLPASELSEQSSLGLTPGWDSMAHVNLMMFLEEQFGIEITEATLERFSSLGEILTLTGDSK